VKGGTVIMCAVIHMLLTERVKDVIETLAQRLLRCANNTCIHFSVVIFLSSVQNVCDNLRLLRLSFLQRHRNMKSIQAFCDAVCNVEETAQGACSVLSTTAFHFASDVGGPVLSFERHLHGDRCVCSSGHRQSWCIDLPPFISFAR
jgi:hypothetical protein